jgi:Uma2 family endonuclease
MAGIATRTSPRPREKVYTAADLAAMPSELPSGPVLYELDNGDLISMSPPGDEHCAVVSNLDTELKIQGERRGHGKVRCGEVGIVLRRRPDRVVGADAVFVATASLPIRRSPEGYLETIPDLVVEVVSKNDKRGYLQRKVRDYLTAGVRVLWVADPSKRTVTEYRPGREPLVYEEGDTLRVEDVIPGFRLPVPDVFVE